MPINLEIKLPNTVARRKQPGGEGTTAVDAARSLANDRDVGEMNPLHVARVPIQERGKVRFNTIVEAAEKLLMTSAIDDISPHKIARVANVSPSSVYQYFPSMGALFSVMAEKHFMTAFHVVPEALENRPIRSWRDLAVVIVDSAYDFYTQDKISEILFLGVFLSPGVREYSASRLTRLGLWYIEYFKVLYRASDLQGLQEKLVLCLDVTKTVYIRSLSQHGEITEYYRQEARSLVMNYLGEFFAAIEDRERIAAEC